MAEPSRAEGVFWSACFISLAVSDCAGTFNTRAEPRSDETFQNGGPYGERVFALVFIEAEGVQVGAKGNRDFVRVHLLKQMGSCSL